MGPEYNRIEGAHVAQHHDLMLLGEDGNLLPAGSALRSFLCELAPIVIPGMGWSDGACVVLAKALTRWSEKLSPYAWATPDMSSPIWRILAGRGEGVGEQFDINGPIAKRYDIGHSEIILEHFAACWTEPGIGRIILDGDGISTEHDFKVKMLHELSAKPMVERGFEYLDAQRALQDPSLRPDLYDSDESVEQLLASLHREYGEFEPSLWIEGLGRRSHRPRPISR